MKKLFILIILAFFSATLIPQVKNKAVYADPQTGYFDVIRENIAEFNQKPVEKKKRFKMDYEGIDIPKSKNDFKNFWHNDPVNQGMTGTCWSFSTTSMLESEIFRIHGKKIKLSEIHTAYWEYIEKTKGFIRSRGTTHFGEGSQANAVIRAWKNYGIVPLEAYSGLLPGQKSHDHSIMFDEMTSYLQSVKERNAWNETEAVATIKAIMNTYIQAPPETFTYNGKTYTPKDFLAKEVNLNLDDYVALVSFTHEPYGTMVEYRVPDNWWHSKEYNNVALDEYMAKLKKAVRNGYTAVLFGDVSEPGMDSYVKAAMVPSFDIPADYINEDSRQFRFENKTSGDDHGIHCIGYLTKDGKDWFLIKDSGAGSFNTGDKGYYFYHEDYVKLKMLGYFIHKSAL
ncbi:MAG: peptidase C1 [Ignavibacteriaceae bacterium]|nr:peptidase C1 [Ignavibacteriaceae bacterium]